MLENTLSTAQFDVLGSIPILEMTRLDSGAANFFEMCPVRCGLKRTGIMLFVLVQYHIWRSCYSQGVRLAWSLIPKLSLERPGAASRTVHETSLLCASPL